MKETFYKYYKYCVLTLVIFLGLASFFTNIPPQPSDTLFTQILSFFNLPNFYNSIFHIILWLILASILLYGIIRIKNFTPSLKFLFLLIIILIFAIIYEKSVNKNYTVNLRTGEKITLKQLISSRADSFNIQLHDFQIKRNSREKVSVGSESKLILDSKDTISMSINDPIQYNQYKFYQQSYHLYPQINLKINDTILIVTAPDTISYDNQEYAIQPINQKYTRFRIKSDNNHTSLIKNQPVYFESNRFQIVKGEIIKESLIQIKEIQGTKLVLFLLFIYLFSLAYALWGKK